jgi:hypothetical protein
MSANATHSNGSPRRVRSEAEPPSPTHPYWRGPDGARAAFSELIAGRDLDQVAELGELHVEAVCTLVRAGLAAHAGGDGPEARRLFAGAARLCTEPLGHWPSAAMRSDD